MGTNKERTAEVLKVLPFRKPSNQATDDVIARHAELPLLRRGEQQRASAARTRFDAQARNTQTTHICLRLAGKQGTTGTQQRCYLETRERARWKFHISSSLGSRDSFVLLRHLNGFIFSKHSPNHWFFFDTKRSSWKGIQVLNRPACDVASKTSITLQNMIFENFQCIIQYLFVLFSSQTSNKILCKQPIYWFKSTQTLKMGLDHTFVAGQSTRTGVSHDGGAG